MNEPITADEVLARARVAGVTIDTGQIPAVTRALTAGLGALRALDLEAERWSEPPAFDARFEGPK